MAAAAPRPDVLTEATDLDTLLEAIVGKAAAESAPKLAVAPAEPPPPPASFTTTPISDRRASVMLVPEIRPQVEPAPLEAPAERFAGASTVESISEDPLSEYAEESLSEDEPAIDDEPITNTSTVYQLRGIRTSPWPLLAIVGGVALVTVSAITLRSVSTTPADAVPPLVASPPAALPTSYAPPLPAEPVLVTQAAPPGTAVGESPLKPAGPTARGSIATAAAASPAVPTPETATPAADRATPFVAAPVSAATPAPAAAAPLPSPVDEPVATVPREAVTLVEPPPPPSEPKNDPRPPAPAPPAVSSAPPPRATSELVPELPKPAPARPMVPVVAARRLTGGMPEYSSALRQRRVGGIVEVLIRIDLNGRVVSAIAVSGPPPLREAAEAAVLKWRYAPGTRNGIPIETESKVRFSFDPSQSRRP